MGILETMIDIPADHEKNVFGQFDIFAKKIERALHVTLIARDGKVKVLKIKVVIFQFVPFFPPFFSSRYRA